MWFVRRAALASLAAIVGLSAASAASGESKPTATTVDAPPAARAPGAATTPHKKPAHGKRKKHKKTLTTLAAHSTAPTARPTLAASADTTPHGSLLVDDSLLPPVEGGRCPPEMASIEGRFCVDRWEATLVEMSPSGDRPFSPFLVVDGHDVRAASVPGVFPQGYVSGSQASVACQRAGKRLCSPMEWRKACVGPKPRLYGYGESRERGRCNDAGRSPMLAIWGAARSPRRATGIP